MCHIAHIDTAPPALQQTLLELGTACITRFQEVRGARAGIGNGSCCASMRFGPGPLDFAFGQSQAAWLDRDAPAAPGLFNPQNHAERVAFQRATQMAAAQHTVPGAHLFVELPPCAGPNGCAAWLQANTPAALNVWYLYGDTDSMVLAHQQGVQTELATLRHALGLH